jgi:hypothetical protein
MSTIRWDNTLNNISIFLSIPSGFAIFNNMLLNV